MASKVPYDSDAEKSLLGGLMSSRSLCDQLIGELDPNDFYDPANRAIFGAIRKIYTAQEKVDPLGVVHVLRNVPGFSAEQIGLDVHEMLGLYGSSTEAKRSAEIVKDLATNRRLLSAGAEIQGLVNSPGDKTTEEILDAAENLIFDVSKARNENSLTDGKEILVALMDKLEEQESDAVPTGFKNLDELLGGFKPGSLITIGARPAMGKSALLSDFLTRTAKAGGHGVLFSYEMSEDEIMSRIVSATGRVGLDRMVNRRLEGEDWERIVGASAKLSELPGSLYIDDSAGKGMSYIASVCRRLAAKGQLDLVMIDYLQLMTPERGGGENRQQEVSVISRGLKLLARKLRVPVICAVQLNRVLESRGEKRPILSDIRESGSVEQDSDVVMFVHRPEYYDSEDDPGTAEIIVRKNRNGPTGTAYLTFLKQFTTFEDQARKWQHDPGGNQATSQEKMQRKVAEMIQSNEAQQASSLAGSRPWYDQ